MTTLNYIQKIDDLRKRVENHTKFSFNVNKDNDKDFSIKLSNINRGSMVYLLPPLIIIIILVVIKPSFITVDTINKDNIIKKNIVYSKLLVTVLIGGFITYIGLWAFLRKR